MRTADGSMKEIPLMYLPKNRIGGGVNHLAGAEIRSVCEDADEIVLEKDGARYRVDLHSIIKISFV